MLSNRVSSTAPWLAVRLSAMRTPSSTSHFFSTSTARSSYGDTIKNLKIGSHTRVIFQGFTGRQATANAIESLAWGTRIVGGVTPGREGMHPVLQDLPVFPTVKAAMQELKPDATGIYVAAHQAAAAIEEAIEAEIPLIVAVAEHIPVHDMLKIHSMLKSQSKSRLVGANAPGIISAIGRCRIGFQPLPCFTPGHVGIVAKSGTLSYEAVASLTRAGLGQSLCIGMGGDVVAGTDFVDALNVFEDDPDTDGIIIIGEVGGRAEEEAADWIKDYRSRAMLPKPIAALVAGKLAKAGSVMGHAGAWAGMTENSTARKYSILQNAGAIMVDHPSQFGDVMRKSKAYASWNTVRKNNDALILPHKAGPSNDRRRYHTSHRPRHLLRVSWACTAPPAPPHRRTLHLSSAPAADLLSRRGVSITREPHAPEIPHLIAVTIDRSNRAPCLLVCADTVKSIPLDFRQPPTQHAIMEALVHLRIVQDPAAAALTRLILALHEIFIMYEGITLAVKVAATTDAAALLVYAPRFTFDDAAFKSCGRHAALHALRDVSPTAVDPAALAGEADGIVYVKLGPSDRSDPDYTSYNIGTLVNGAGLAMNTIDALALAPHHGRAANFLDTGGKATAETVKKSFELLLSDERVKVIFVNIFGGLTLGDMIARGILLAFQELGLQERGIPVVVRIRGTNEAEGQHIIAESGLKVFAFDGFDEAAAKCVELAKQTARV